MMQLRIIFIIVLLVACSGGGGGSPNGTTIVPQVSETGRKAHGKCRHEALIASVIYEESGYQTRILYGPIPDSDEYHVQAQALIDGQWEWLSVRTIFVHVDSQDDFEVTKEYSTDEIYDNCVGGVWY